MCYDLEDPPRTWRLRDYWREFAFVVAVVALTAVLVAIDRPSLDAQRFQPSEAMFGFTLR